MANETLIAQRSPEVTNAFPNTKAAFIGLAGRGVRAAIPITVFDPLNGLGTEWREEPVGTRYF